MYIPIAEATLIILSIILTALQIFHTIMGIRKDADDEPEDQDDQID